ncbi:MAG: hypothetical protein ACKOTZ_11815 [Chloroflexota bacterium]
MRPQRLRGPVIGSVLVLLLAAAAPGAAQSPPEDADPLAAPVAWIRLVHAGTADPAQLRVDGDPVGGPVPAGDVLPWVAVAPAPHVLSVDGGPVPLPTLLAAGDRLTLVAAPGTAGLLLLPSRTSAEAANEHPEDSTQAALSVIDARGPGAAALDLRGGRAGDGVLVDGLVPGGEARPVALTPGVAVLSLRVPGASANVAALPPSGFDVGSRTMLVVRDGTAGTPEIALLPDALPGERPPIAVLSIGPAGPGPAADTLQPASPRAPVLRYVLVNRLPHPVIVRLTFGVQRADGRVVPEGRGWTEPYGASGHLVPPRTDVGPGVSNGLLLLNGTVPDAARFRLVPAVTGIATVRVDGPIAFAPAGWPGGTPAAEVRDALGLPEGTTQVAYADVSARYADGRFILELAAPVDPPIAFCGWMRGSAERAWRRVFPCTPVRDTHSVRVSPRRKGSGYSWMWGLCGSQSFITPFDPDAPVS